MATLLNAIAENWTVWFVTVVLIVAAIIDGAILKVPNWLTFPFILCGWAHWTMQDGFSGTVVTLWAFAATAVVGGVMAAFMIWKSGEWHKHFAMAHQILHEWKTVRDPQKLAAIARERKPNMYLLPYGIPMAIGSIAYFALAGMLV